MRAERADGLLDAPVRPSVPPLAWFCLAQFAGVLAAEALAWGALEDGREWIRAAGILAGLVAGVLGICVRRRGALALCAWGLALGLLSGGAFWGAWASDSAGAQSEGGPRLVDVTGDARLGAFGAVSAGRIGRTEVDIAWPKQVRPPEAGERVELSARAVAPKHDPAGRRAHQAGVTASLRARRVTTLGATPGPQGWALPLRLWALRRVNTVPGTGGDLLAGVLLGDRRRLAGTAADDDFRTCGLTHLVAVSGGHLAVVAACAVWALSLMRAGPRTRATAVGLLCAGYVALTGVQPSAVRSWIMALALTGALASGRRGDALAALSAAAALMMALDPSCAFDLGFRLSVVSVAALVAFARLTAVWLTAALPRPAAGLAPPLAASLTAQAATTPLSAAVFGALSLVAPLANLLAGPAVALAIVTGGAALALAALAPPLGALLLRLAGAILAVTAAVAAHLAAWPFAAVPVSWVPIASAATLTATAALWVAWPAPSRRLARGALAVALVAALALFGLPSTAPPELVVLDVGQGDAILVRDGPHAVLVDAGPSAVLLRQALARHRIRHLDAAIASHLHADHVAGFKGLDGLVRADTMFVPPGCDPADLARTLPADPRPQALGIGDTVRCGAWRLRVVWPPPGRDPNENDGCLVLLAERPGVRVLLTGDAEADVLGELEREHRLADVDVLKVGHHGSSDAVSADTLAALAPEAAIISVGEGNRFGHPRQDTLDILGVARVPVWRTDILGEITVRPTKAGIRLIPRRRARYNASAAHSETKGPYVLGKKARLRPLRCRGSPHRPRRGEHPCALRRRSRPRLQPHVVRRGQRLRRRDRRGVQHDAVPGGHASRHREERGQARYGEPEQARGLRGGSLAVRLTRASGREVSQGLEAPQGHRGAWRERLRQGVQGSHEARVPGQGARDVRRARPQDHARRRRDAGPRGRLRPAPHRHRDGQDTCVHGRQARPGSRRHRVRPLHHRRDERLRLPRRARRTRRARCDGPAREPRGPGGERLRHPRDGRAPGARTRGRAVAGGAGRVRIGGARGVPEAPGVAGQAPPDVREAFRAGGAR